MLCMLFFIAFAYSASEVSAPQNKQLFLHNKIAKNYKASINLRKLNAIFLNKSPAVAVRVMLYGPYLQSIRG